MLRDSGLASPLRESSTRGIRIFKPERRQSEPAHFSTNAFRRRRSSNGLAYRIVRNRKEDRTTEREFRRSAWSTTAQLVMSCLLATVR